MGRVSTIKRLPPELREQISDLFEQGRTLDEIKGALSSLDVNVSRSALFRHKKNWEKISSKLWESRAVAEELVKGLGKAPESKTARLNIELMHSAVLDVLRAAEGDDDNGPIALDPKEAMLLAKALDHLAKAQRSDAELILKIRTEEKKRLQDEAKDRLTQAGKTGGLDPEAAQEALRILGFA